MFQVKITGWIFHGVWVVRGEQLREIIYKSAIFIYFDIQKTFYCCINICSKIRKRSLVSLAVFMFKKNPKKPPFLWATDEETPLMAISGIESFKPVNLKDLRRNGWQVSSRWPVWVLFAIQCVMQYSPGSGEGYQGEAIVDERILGLKVVLS